MSRGFQAHRGGPTVVLATVEVSVLRDLLRELLEVLGPPRIVEEDEDPLIALTGLTGFGGDPSTPSGRPADPVLSRLLPDGIRDNPGAAAEFRRLTEGELRDGKRQAARAVLSQVPARGGRVHLDPEQAEVWLGVLNDLRLALGTRLDVSQDDDLDRGPSEPAESESDPDVLARLLALDVYHWLGFLQGTLLQAMQT